MIYALDSNIISYLLKKDKQVEQKFKEAVDNGHEYIIPPMVYYEIKRWLVHKNAKEQLSRFNNLYSVTREIPMDILIWDKAVELYAMLAKKGNLIGDADTLIAAYCVVNDFTLVTNNTSDFERIPDIKYINWVK
jgi:predicted nucleic acid-binding protein